MAFREMPEWAPKPIVSAAATGVVPRALAGFCLSQRNSCSSLEHRFLALHRLEIAADSRWAPLRLERHAGPQEDGSGASSWRELELDSVSYLVPLALAMLWQRRERLGTIARVVATVALLRASYQTSAVLDTNAWSTVASSRGAGSSVDSSPVMPSAPMAEP